MDSTEQNRAGDAPVRLRKKSVAERYTITERLAAEWLRAAHAADVVRKLRSVFVGRWSALDAWVAAGGQVPARRRGGR